MSLIEIDWKRPVLPPYQHQRDGVKAILKLPNVFLADDVGAGKTKQVIDAAHFAFLAGLLDTVVVVAPASVRSVWVDPDPVLGEVAKHCWRDVQNLVVEFHSKTKVVEYRDGALNWVVTNYEFIRNEDRLKQLKRALKGRRYWLVGDESWAIAGHKSLQNAAFSELAALATKRVIMNGTPGGPQEVFGQLHATDPSILGYKDFWQFRGRHAVMGGWKQKQIVKWKNMEEFDAKTARVTLRRMTRDCVDLPRRLPPVLIEARLTPETWDVYSEMKKNLVAWFGSADAAVAKNAGVKAVRLAQIAAGFLGGVISFDEGDGNPWEDRDFEDIVDPKTAAQMLARVQEVGREKLDASIGYLDRWWSAEPQPRKAILSGRFRPEIERAQAALQDAFPKAKVYKLYGSQDEDERTEVKRMFAPGGEPDEAILVIHPAAGGAGLNLSAANLLLRMSPDHSLKNFLQLDGRIERPGQSRPMTFGDVVAVGPNGQRTVDHIAVAGLRKKEDVSKMTAKQWRKALEEQ
jgi:hypothetical protein